MRDEKEGQRNRPDAPHSCDYFTPVRRYWWNADFLELMARRWALSAARSALDVGCGVGHWSAVLRALLPAKATLLGIDREPRSVAIARDVAAGAPGPPRHHLVATAEALPFPDASFDLVSCQTLLIHVRDPRAVLREMLRVLAPGGLLAVVEPNNSIVPLVAGHAGPLAPAQLAERVAFLLTCQEGRIVIGEGDFSVGEAIPGMLAELGLAGIRVFLSDKTLPLFPPYAGDEPQALLAPLRADADPEFWLWSKADTRRYFLAGGGAASEFDRGWESLLDDHRTEKAALRAGTLQRAGGRLHYLCSGRKPGSARPAFSTPR